MNSVNRYREVIFTSILDFLILLAAWFVFHLFFTESVNIHLMHLDVNFASAGVILSFYWVLIFVIAGLYKKLYLVSRLDEFFRVLKTTIIGGLILYFMLDFGDRASFEADRAMVIYYWGFIFGIVALNRFIIRTIQRFYAQKGKGLHRTIIVGTGHNAKVAFDDLIRNKTLGMEVLGYVQVNGKSLNPEIGIQQEEVIGHLENIAAIVEEYKVQDVLVAIDPE